ncbi:MAG: hypothetical protein V4690_04420 [Patescibacteria group bacterium]
MSKFFYFFLFFVLMCLPTLSSAQSVYMRTSKTNVYTNESVLVTLYIDTKGNSINTIGGKVNIPALATTGDIRYGSSIISLWVDKPTWNSGTRSIAFTGGIPGGFNGGIGTIMSFVVRPSSEGTMSISLQDVSVLLNDGSGSELKVSTPTLVLTVGKAPVVPKTEPTKPVVVPTKPTSTETPIEVEPMLPADTVAPESFVPMVTRHESVEENKYFVSFFAVDKDSGISKYEVKEVMSGLGILGSKFQTEWQEATSPYILKYQKWGSRVEIKAYDNAGNVVVSKTSKPFDGTVVLALFVGAILATFVVTRTWFSIKPKRRVSKS